MDLPITFISKDGLKLDSKISVKSLSSTEFPPILRRFILESLRNTTKFSKEDTKFDYENWCKYREYKLERLVNDETTPNNLRLIYKEI